MSASKEKKRRQAGDILDKRQREELEAKRKKKRNTILVVIIAVAVVLLIAFAILVNSSLLYTTGTALTVGDRSFTAADVNYFYYSAYYNEYESYGDYASYILDSSKPLSEQEYSEGYTWDDHFRDLAISNMTDTVMLCDEAEAEGFTLSEESLAEIENNIYNYQIMASYYGYKSANAYYAANFGKGVDESVIRRDMELVYLADAYRTDKKASFEYSNSEIDSYYNENSDTYDAITYRQYYVNGSEDNGTNMEEAKATADYLTSATSETEFAERIYEVCPETQKDTYENLDATKHTYLASTISSNYNEWLLDSSRKAGDVEAVEVVSESTSAAGYYVVYFIDRDSNDYSTSDIRYALISAATDDAGAVTEDALAAAKAEAETAYTEWKDGEATEDTFITMVTANSDNSDTAAIGGLDENVNKVDVGTYGEDMVAWALSGARKAGDTDMFETATGYYIVYFVEKNDEPYSRTLARTDMQQSAYDEWDAAQLENYNAQTGAMMFKVGN